MIQYLLSKRTASYVEVFQLPRSIKRSGHYSAQIGYISKIARIPLTMFPLHNANMEYELHLSNAEPG